MNEARSPRASVVIPAHNEETVIGRCLGALQPALDAGWAEVFVICNGCTDDTARQARTHQGVTVLELPEASKIAALRAGDSAATSFPRVYLDADVELSAGALQDLVRDMEETGAPAGRPTAQLDTTSCSWPVQRFYAARARVPTLNAALWGAGVYALSQEGRARFGDWPEVVADDLFIDGLFSSAETLLISSPVTVHPPRRATDLLRTLRRVYRGNREQPQQTTGSRRSRPSAASTALAVLRTGARGLSPAFDAVTYAALVTAARVQHPQGRAVFWERDESTRAAA